LSLDATMPHEYLVGHLEEALARDPRVAEQGLAVRLAGTPLRVTVAGTVVAAPHKAAITSVVRELLPDAEVNDETRLADFPEDPDTEEVV
jgi:hypothetical protein